MQIGVKQQQAVAIGAVVAGIEDAVICAGAVGAAVGHQGGHVIRFHQIVVDVVAGDGGAAEIHGRHLREPRLQDFGADDALTVFIFLQDYRFRGPLGQSLGPQEAPQDQGHRQNQQRRQHRQQGAAAQTGRGLHGLPRL